MVWTSTTIVSDELLRRTLELNWVFFSVDWSELYPSDFYEKQDQIYRTERPRLMPDTLAVPKRYIRKHISDLAQADRRDMKRQIEAFRQGNPNTIRRKLLERISFDRIQQCFRVTTIDNIGRSSRSSCHAHTGHRSSQY